MSLEKLISISEILIVAGSETVATLLSGVTYYVLTCPDAFQKLTEEVRSAFKSEDEINIVSVNRLTYMLACLDEALRMYHPVANGLPRVVPKGGANIIGRYVPENVCCCNQSIPRVRHEFDINLRPSLQSTNGLYVAGKSTSPIRTTITQSDSWEMPISPMINARHSNPSTSAPAIVWGESECRAVSSIQRHHVLTEECSRYKPRLCGDEAYIGSADL
jgi:hypothetical protein